MSTAIGPSEAEAAKISDLPAALEITDKMLIPIEDESGTTMSLTGAALKAYIIGLCPAVTLESIAVTVMPNKTSYIVGDMFDATGMVVTAYYSDGTSKEVNSYTYDPLEFSVAGDQTVTISYAEKGVTKTTAINASVEEPALGAIYGVYWDGSESTPWTRTDAAVVFSAPVPAIANGTGSSPFDNIMPWSGMQVVEDSEAGTLVSIPKFWYQLTQNGKALTIRIANYAAEGFHVSPAHMDRGDGTGERDVVYIGRYHCATSTYKSTTGAKPATQSTRSEYRIRIHSLGSTIWQSDWAMRLTVWLLYLVEIADWDSQLSVGYGCGDDSGIGVMGYTDNMQYHTGTTQSDRTTYGLGTQYRYIEGLWDNAVDYCDGCYSNSNGLNIILNPNHFSDTTNGMAVGVPVGDGVPTEFIVTDAAGFPMFIPSGTGGSTDTYSCDSWNFYANYECIYAGGSYGQSLNFGLFYLSYARAASTLINCTARLMKLP